jgi:threonine aldolase
MRRWRAASGSGVRSRWQRCVGPAGDAVLLDRTAHPLNFEAGGPAVLSGAVLRPLDGDGGIFSAEQLEQAIRSGGDRYAPRPRLVSVEQTTNIGGGRVWPLETIRGVLDVAGARGMGAHLDGARLMNAVVASGISAAEQAAGFDTAWIDFTKGLGAPVGARVETNIVLIEVDDAGDLAARLEEQGVLLSVLGPQQLRAVTHLDVDHAGVERARSAIRAALAG